MYGIDKEYIKEGAVGFGISILLKLVSVLFPIFSIAIPMFVGLSIWGTYAVAILIAPLVEEPIFRFFLLGYLADKKKVSKKDLGRLQKVIIAGIFFSMLILVNFYYRAGIIYTILGGIALVVAIFWNKITSLNLPFFFAALLSSFAFSLYHIRIYAGIIELSAILSVSSAFISAFLVGMILAYLVKYQKSLIGAICCHAGFNALIMFSALVII